MVEEEVSRVDGAVRPFEWWMTSNLALGLAFTCFLPVLLPAYVLSAGGTATDVWVAMSMAGLFALLGPSIGRIAGRHRAHRLVQVLGLLGLATGLVTLELSSGESVPIVLAIAVMGISAAAVAVAAPAFIMGTDIPVTMQARQLTWLQLNLDLGKIVGGLLLTIMAAERLSFHTQFGTGGLVIGLLAILVWLTSGRAARRIRRPELDLTVASGPAHTVVPWKTLLLSLFGVPVVAQLLGSHNLVEVQISAMLTLSGMVGICLYFVVGHWVRSGPGLVWAIGHALRGIGGIVLGILGVVRGTPYLLVLAAFLVIEAAPAIVWLLQSRSETRATVGAGVVPAGAARSSLRSEPAGRPSLQQGRPALPTGIALPASPSPVPSRPA
ncbi:MAG TPA: hypothetical protein VGL88_05815 [Pseudonocardiaceae bacterium]